MIIIKEVKTKKDLKKFIKFPIKLYKDYPNYIPPIIQDDIKDFSFMRNPSYKVCKSKSFLAYKDNVLVGRICALYNPLADEKFNTKRIRFRHFDTIDDIEVTKALFKAARDYALELNIEEIEGPNGFSDMDKEGMLIEGFDKENLFFTYYNAPYYQKHMEEIGMTKNVDWVEFRVGVPQHIDDRLERISKLVFRRGFKVLSFKNHRELKPYIHKVFEVYNEAYAPLYGTVPLNDELVDYYMGSFLPILNLDYISIIEDKDGKIAGFAVVVPSIDHALKKCGGKLFPFGWYHILKALNHNDTVDMLLIAARPDLQGQGINAVLMLELLKACLKHGIKYAETGPHLESNTQVISLWKNYEHKLVRRRRLFIANLKDLKVD